MIRGRSGTPARAGDLLGLDLVAHAADDVRGGADEADAFLLAHRREICVLGEESVTRVDRIDLVGQCGADDRTWIPVALGRACAGPMQTAWSASLTGSESASASE